MLAVVTFVSCTPTLCGGAEGAVMEINEILEIKCQRIQKHIYN